MGKGLRHRDSSFTRESNSLGCMFGILHHLHHHHPRWHQVRKRLPHIRQGGGKHVAGAGDLGSNANATDSANIPEKVDVKADDSPIAVKTAGAHPKGSIKSRLKALITKELSRKRVRHCRSVSCPTGMPMEQSAPINYLDPATPNPSSGIPLNGESLHHPQNEYSSVASLLDPPLPKKRKGAVTTNNTCELCAAMLDMNQLKQLDINQHGKQPITGFTLRRTQSLYFSERAKNASIEESKLFLDALDLLNMRKEVFLKILQDPNSTLAHQLHGTRAAKALTKSVSFPAQLSLERTSKSSNHKSRLEFGHNVKEQDKSLTRGELSVSAGFESAELLNRHSETLTNLSSEDEVAKSVLKRSASFDNVLPSSPSAKQNRHQRKLVLERFRNLREKIKHALKESSKEKHRIVMDAVLHKVPHDGRLSKDVKKATSLLENPTADGHENFPEGCNTAHNNAAFSKSQMKSFKRTSSLNDSLDRYNRLLETCSSRDEKQNSSERSSLRPSRSPSPARSGPIVLERILSLPDLRNCPSFRIEDSPEASYSETLGTAASSNNVKLGATRSNEQKSLDIPLGLEKQTQQEVSNITENFVDASETSDDFGGLKTEENSLSVEYNMEGTSSHNSKLDKLIPSPTPDNILQEATTVPAELSATKDNGLNSDEEEISANEQKRSLLQVQVDERNKTEFNYVKDVLELSGFSGNDFLGKWQFSDLQMNPSLFEEGYTEGGSCDQLLLFDLINEVLLQFYERSSLYWPKPLTSCSCIHPMPMGYHLLEEVWTDISWCLSFNLENDQSLDIAVTRDLAKGDNWMNLQFDSECVGLELEDLIFDDLLEELSYIDVY